MSPIDELVPLLEKLRLSGVLQSLELRIEQAAQDNLAPAEFLLRLFTDEVERRDAKMLEQRIRWANFEHSRTLEDFAFHFNPQLPNLFGTFRVCRAILPRMRAQGAGRIINVSSIGGLIALPFQGLYCASKFAVEGMTEALRREVKPFGIDVTLVEPGDFLTAFTQNRSRVAASGKSSVYDAQMQISLGITERDEQRGPAPIEVARLIEKIIATRNPRLRYSVGMFHQSFHGECGTRIE
jgi:NAD(P)-dependent dehydrogenase (short-subunit alcohol dehydrogenase family)